MANSQPPYGIPGLQFPIPPQQPPAPPQGDAQGQALSAEAMQNLLNWQAFNLHAYGQNAQQPSPFPLWPPPPPVTQQQQQQQQQQQSDYAPLPFPPPFLTHN